MPKNVKVVSPKNAEWRDWYNKGSDYRTQKAKSGNIRTGNVEMQRTEQANAAKREAGKTPKIKIDSNPVKPGKTIVGPLAKGAGSGGVAGLALGAIAAFNEEAARVASAKRKRNRMN